MPVITRGSGLGTGGGSGKGYPTADVSGIQILPGVLSAKLKWTDPDDTIVDNAVLSEWQSTIIVRKEGAVPDNIKDGTVVIECNEKNKYKETWYEDKGLVEGKTYYYRFFTKSASGVIGDGSPTVKIIAVAVSTTLAENSWDVISSVSQAGTAQNYWSVGDEIDVELTGTYAQKITLRIAGFKHDDLSDGSGKAAITFICKYPMQEELTMDSPSSGYPYHYGNTKMHKETMNEIKACLPMDLQTAIKTITKKCEQVEIGLQNVQCELFLLSCYEILGKSPYSKDGERYPVFTTGSTVSGVSSGEWWTRTPYNFDKYVCITGSSYTSRDSGEKRKVVFGFCL